MIKVPMTTGGYEKLKEELRWRQQEERPRIIEAISEARAHGDLSENAEYHAAKEAQSLNEGRVGEIYVVGVAPEHHGQGIGSALVALGLRRMKERGVDVAAIYVDDTNTGALCLYEAAGFHYHHVDVCYERELRASESAPTPVAEHAA